MKSSDSTTNHICYFQFLNFWTKQEGFLNIVKEAWSTNINNNSIWTLQSKLMLLSRRLSQWSREEVGSTHAHVLKWEEKIQTLEELEIANIEDDIEEN